MKNKKFDQELKSELENYQSSADPAAIWAAIGSEVDQINEVEEEENKRPMVWIFGLLSIGFLMILAISWNINTNELESPLTDDLNNKTQTAKPVDSKTQSLLATYNSQISNLAKVANKKNETIDSQKSVANSSFPNSKKTKLALVSENNKKSSFLTSRIQNKNTNLNPWTPINQKQSIALQNFSTKKEKSKISEKINNSNHQENNQRWSATKQNPKKQILIPILILENDQLINDPTNELARIIVPEIVPTPSFADRRRRRTPAWNLGLEIQGGASLTNRKLTLVDNEDVAYLNLREATESALETIQIGGKVELQHRTGFSISTGIQWSRITEKYSIEEKIIEERLENTLISFSIDMNQDTVNRTYDDILRTRTTTATREGFNRYRLLDIPFLVGYHFKNEKWSLGLETGILANLNLSTKGFVYNENSQLVDLDANQKNVFKANVGLGFYVGATGRVALRDNIQISINPFYRINGGSFTISENLIAQKYSWIGMNVGLRYGF